MNNQIAPGLTVNEGESVSGFLLSSVGGELQSRSPDGNVTKLYVGAPLIEGHTLVSPQGGQFLVVMSDGTVRELPRSGEFLISGTLLEQLAVIDSDSGQYQQLLAGLSSGSGNGSEMASAATGGDTQPPLTEDARELLAQTGLDPDNPEFLELLAALQAGEDISEKLEAPAAGEGGNTPSSESIQNATQFVFLNPQVRPTAGIDPDLTLAPGPIPTADSSFAVETVDDSPTTPPDDNPTTPPDDNPSTPPDDNPSTPPDDNPSTPPDDNPSTPPDDNPSTPPDDNPTTPPDDNPTTPPDDESPGDSELFAGVTSASVDDDGLSGPPAGNSSSTAGDLVVPNTDGDNNESTFSGTLTHDFGGDGPGAIDFAAMDGQSAAVGQETVNFSWAGNTLTATISGGVRDGTDLFTVTVTNASTGAYSVALLTNVIHETLDGLPGDNTENDAIVALTFTVSDTNNSTANGVLNITFDDDMPSAVADSADQSTFGVSVTTNVMANDAQGADGALLTAATVLNGEGTLEFLANGEITYTPSAGEQGVVTVGYTLTDTDGDSASSTLTLNLLPGLTTTIGDAQTDILSAFEAPSGGAQSLVMTIALSQVNNTGGPVTVYFDVDEGADNADLDLSGLTLAPAGSSGMYQVTIANGDQTAVLTLPVVDDAVVEAVAENVTVTLQGTDNAAVTASDSAVGTLTDLNGALTIADAGTVTEGGDLTFNLSLDITSGTLPAGATVVVPLDWSGSVAGDADFTSSLPGSVSLTVAGDGLSASGSVVLSSITGDGFEGTEGLSVAAADGSITVNGVAAEGLTGDTATGALQESAPIGGDSDSLTIYESALDLAQDPNDLAAGVVNGTNPVSEAETDITGALEFTATNQAITSFNFVTTGITVSNGGDGSIPVIWSLNGANLEGRIGGNLAIVLSLSGSTIAPGSSGSVSVTATLTDAFPHDNSPNASSLLISGIQVVASTDSGDTAQGALSVTVVDDQPSIHRVENSITHNDNALGDFTGRWSYASGADDFGSISVSLTNSPSVIASTSVSYNGAGEPTLLGKYADGSDYFSLTINKDGTYDFDIIEANPTTVIMDTSSLGGSIGGNKPALYLEEILVKQGGLTSLNTDIKFTSHEGFVSITNLGKAGTVNTNANAIGASGTGNMSSLPVANSESLTLTFLQYDGDANGNTHPTTPNYVESVELGFASNNGSAINPQNVTFIVHYSDSAFDAIIDNVVNGKYLIEAPAGREIARVDVVNNGASESFLINSVVTKSEVDTITPDDVVLDFQVSIADSDGDSDGFNFSVGIEADGVKTGSPGDDVILGAGTGEILNGLGGHDMLSGLGGNDTINGGAGDDLLFGGTGNDVLNGGSGADTFIWRAGDASGSALDVLDFNPTEGDVLELGDLLIGEEMLNHSAHNLLAQGLIDNGYISVTQGTNTTLVVNPDGVPGGDTQTLTLNNFDTSNAGNYPDSYAVIEHLLSGGNLVVD